MNLLNLWKDSNKVEKVQSDVHEWTKERIDYITKNYKSMKYSDIADHLGVSYNTINNKLYIMRKKGIIPYSDSSSLWEDQEVEFLTSNYKEMTAKELAEKLGRSVNSVRSRILRLRKSGELDFYKLNIKK